MYIIYSGPDDSYASAAVSKRNGQKTSIETIYLGRVLDKEAGIYKSRERGVFTFNPETGEYGSVPEDYVPPKHVDGRKNQSHYSVDFGDAYFINAFLHDSGMINVVDTIGYSNPDTLHSMLLFYTLSSLANCDAIHWYEGSITRLLYPKAKLEKDEVFDFLSSIGNINNVIEFQSAYLDYISDLYVDDVILIDSLDLSNCIYSSKSNDEVRPIVAVQKSTGLPIYYKDAPNNFLDISAIERILLHLESMGVDVSGCILDAGYNSGDDLDLFYENHKCTIEYIIKVGAIDKEFRLLIFEELANIERKENLVIYEDRYMFIVKKMIMVGKNKDNRAYMYLVLDSSNKLNARKDIIKAVHESKLSIDDIYEAIHEGIIFGLLSGKDYSCEEIIQAYHQNQDVIDSFKLSNFDYKITKKENMNFDILKGHFLLSFIASCIINMMKIKLNSNYQDVRSKLATLRNQKCTIYPNKVEIDEARIEAQNIYDSFKVLCNKSIPVVDGKISQIKR